VKRVVLLSSALLLITLPAGAQLGVRSAKLEWDKTNILRGKFDYNDAIDDKIKKRLVNGLPVTIVMRGYVYRNNGGDPIALTAHTCRVAYDLWQEVFRVVVNGVSKPPVVNLKGVYRNCTEMVELPVVERATLKGAKGSDFYLAVKVEVNPVSAALQKQIENWVTRPSGVSGGLTAGDALFATFVSVFIKKQLTADNVVEFRTAVFPP
jgi:hypothetical protein